ncbi:protein-tyrosine phosphatase [Nakamurella panacisegetis]|uniref:Protein-tyrosine phosphatase n=1 Tax=Nakamurella panacisegetis TaxID=1090615 RepID=A0A1H0JEY6_9ACTN|nr:tyrosine-protein phosphatase [Nakamurella panacisegetis]SDO42152.1 protein-tyrosine phosphatase [Nakamurella panacisegetis]
MALLNFRDVATSGDSPLKPGRLFRSAQPFHLDGADLALISQAGIRTIIDLREPHEQVPPDWAPVLPSGVRVVRLPVADQILPSEDEQAPPRAARPEPESIPEGHRILAAFYRAIVDRAGVRLSELATVVADGGPVLLHCAAGKDRTGTTVALLLDLIGTDHEVIVADFVRTTDALPAVLAQLTGMVRPENRRDPASIPPGIADAPESAIRALLTHVAQAGGPAAVLGRHADRTVLDRLVATLTS